MQDYDSLKPCLEYIEQNLKSIIRTEELADIAGYSVWHFSRCFTKTTGLPVAAYISKRRLDRALGEIIGGRRAVDSALDYGFETYAGFYKAFVRAYGSSPKSYLSKKETLSMFTEKELLSILGNWDIPQDLPILDVYVLDGAAISGNVWSIGEEYILKSEKKESLLRNLQVAKALAAQGFAAATPILTKTGAEYLDGEQITVLIKGIKGSPLEKADRFGDDRKSFGYKYGESIARLHRVLAAIEPEIKPAEQDLFATVSGWALPETKRQNEHYQMRLPDGFFEDYLHSFESSAKRLPKQLIHRDPNPSNILFDGGDVSGFIDFDLSQRNARLFDPCYCATGILSERRGIEGQSVGAFDKWPDVLEGILHGYDSVNPLTAEEKQSVYYMLCSIQMIFVAYCEPRAELKELAIVNREMLQYIVSSRAQLEGVF